MLVNEGVLPTLDFTDFETCVECIEGKQTNKSSKGAKRSPGTLEIVHINICGPFSIPCIGVQKYFIACIDDPTRFYVSLSPS